MCSLYLFTLAAIGAGEVSFDSLPTRVSLTGDKQRVLISCPRHFEEHLGQAENRVGISAIATTHLMVLTSSQGNNSSGKRLLGKG